MKLISIIIFSICGLLKAEDRIEAYVSFEKEKIWFRVYSEDAVFLVLSGSSLDGDKLISRNERIHLQPNTRGYRWFLSLPKDKPQLQDGVNIFNYLELKKMLLEKKKLQLEAVKIFKVKDGIFSGPHVIAPSFLREVDLKEDLTNDGLIFIPLKEKNQ